MRIVVFYLLAVCLILTACKTSSPQVTKVDSSVFTVAFGSCNRHDLPNKLWDDVRAATPDVWIWGGDIIYADTDNMVKLSQMYDAQKAVPGYNNLATTTEIIGTWDDHDYGLNDGGADFIKRAESQQVFLNFMGVDPDDPRRKREGIYTSHSMAEGQVKILILDTRYFRSGLIPDTLSSKRYMPTETGTMLGDAQWKWLQSELETSRAKYNIIVSSIQVLSADHGYESWGNFPRERERLISLIADSDAKGVVIISGDRHISEFSVLNSDELEFPLVDFTSSGLTHTYTGFTSEYNPYRVGEVVVKESFGLLNLPLDTDVVKMQIVGDQGKVLEELEQRY